MVGLEHQHAKNLFAELHVALDCAHRRARRVEEADDVGAALLAAQLIRQLSLIPLLNHQDLAAMPLDDPAAGVDRTLRLGRGRRSDEEHRLILVGLWSRTGLLFLCHLSRLCRGGFSRLLSNPFCPYHPRR
jgi:hypothetical protein